MKVLNQVEEWRPITGYEGLYEISNLGRVKTHHTRIGGLQDTCNHIMKQSIMGGYYKVVLRKDGKKKMVNVHRLVVCAFLDNRLGLKEVNHVDENKLNNNVTNLEWCSHRYNIAYSHNIEKAYNAAKKSVNVWRKNGEYVNRYESTHEAARKLHCDQRHISKCCNGKIKSHKGLIFKFA